MPIRDLWLECDVVWDQVPDYHAGRYRIFVQRIGWEEIRFYDPDDDWNELKNEPWGWDVMVQCV
jgi:hypothetical protein